MRWCRKCKVNMRFQRYSSLMLCRLISSQPAAEPIFFPGSKVCTIWWILIFAGGLLLDQSWPEVVRVVRQIALAVGNRAVRTRRSHGAFSRHAYVHHQRLAEDWHESRRPAIGSGPPPRKGSMTSTLSWPGDDDDTIVNPLGKARSCDGPQVTNNRRQTQLE